MMNLSISKGRQRMVEKKKTTKKAPAKKVAEKPVEAQMPKVKIDPMPEVEPAPAPKVVTKIQSVQAELSEGSWLIKIYREVEGSLVRSKFVMDGSLTAGKAIGEAIDQI